MEALNPYSTAPTAAAELDRLERIIRRGLVTFYEVGDALIQIREKEYYREVLGFDTFEAYCEKKWGMSRRHANRLIAATEVRNNILTDNGTIGPVPEPEINNLDTPEPEPEPESPPFDSVIPEPEMSESQLRPLAALPPEEQKPTFELAKETVPAGEKLTAAHVEKTVREVKGEKARKVKSPGEEKNITVCDGCADRRGDGPPKLGVKIPKGAGRCVREGGLCEKAHDALLDDPAVIEPFSPGKKRPPEVVQIIINYIELINDTDPDCKESLRTIALHVWNRQHRRVGDL